MVNKEVKGLYLNSPVKQTERNNVWYSPALDELMTMLNGPEKGKEDAEYNLVVGNMLYIPVFYIGTL